MDGYDRPYLYPTGMTITLLTVRLRSKALVPEVGLEPTSLAAFDFESNVYTIPPLRQ